MKGTGEALELPELGKGAKEFIGTKLVQAHKKTTSRISVSRYLVVVRGAGLEPATS